MWYVCYCEPRKEFQAQLEIKNHGIETFLPVLTRAKMIRRKRVILTEPIFSRYLFVQIGLADLARHYSQIKRARGVLHLIEGPNGPSLVSEAVIGYFKEAERAGAFDYSKPQVQFLNGDNVQIMEGPFAGIIAKVKSASASKRIKLLMRLLGGMIETEAEACNLQKVG